MNTLKVAFNMASPGFSDITKNLSPDLIVYDFLQPWTPEITRLHNIPAVNFWSVGAGMTSFFFHAIKNIGEELPFEATSLHDHERWKFEQLHENSAGGITDEDRGLQCVQRSSGIIFRRHFGSSQGSTWTTSPVLWAKRWSPVGPLVQDPREKEKRFLLDRSLAVPFIWVLPFPVGESMELPEALPAPGFLIFFRRLH